MESEVNGRSAGYFAFGDALIKFHRNISYSLQINI